MTSANEKLRGRQKKLNFEYSACIALLCAFAGMIAFVALIFMASADANDVLNQRLNSNPEQLQTASAEGHLSETVSSSAASRNRAKGVAASATGDGSNAVNAVLLGESSKGRRVKARAIDNVREKHYVTYRWEGIEASDTSVLFNEAGSWTPVFLPFMLQVRAGQNFTVNSDYSKGLTLYTQNGKVRTGKYVFSGWSLTGTQTMPDEDVVITGTWEYTKLDGGASDDDGQDGDDKKDDDKKDDEANKKHSVTYSWSNAPLAMKTGTYVDEAGNEVDVSLPSGFAVEEGKEFSVDSKWKAGAKIFFKDSKTGTLQRQYVFDGWSVTGTQRMGKADVKITGTWSDSLVSRWVRYDWHESEGAVHPDEGCVLYKVGSKNKVTVKFPEDAEVVAGITIVLDDTFELDEKYEERDESGAVKCYWTFQGWDSSDVEIERNLETNKLEFVVGNTDITINGLWKCEMVQDVAS